MAESAEGLLGHIVMLVDNAVEGDSRVQKTARTTAAAGWRVTLPGVTVDSPRQWRCGDAEARTVRIAKMPKPRRRHYRWNWRAPLAFRTPAAQARCAELLGLYRADLACPPAARRPGPLRRWTHAVRKRWFGLRARQTTVKLRVQQQLTVWDRVGYRFVLAVRGRRAWRTLEPYLWRYELALGPLLDQLRPTLVHANDTRMLGVAVRAARRARLAAHEVPVVWDAHEYLPGLRAPHLAGRWLPAHLRYQREYVPHADAVVTVSEPLADLLRADFALAHPPTVLRNVPAFDRAVTDADRATYGDVRTACGLAPDVPLLVNSGTAAPQRGIGTFVEALPGLPGVHLALVVSRPDSPYLIELRARAAELGVADRLHTTRYVPEWYVVEYLRTASVGLIGAAHWPNHELSLHTKFFEYAHARLPLVSTDVETTAAAVRRTGHGEVYRAEDVADFVRAVTAVLAAPGRYRAAYAEPELLADWTWASEVRDLHRLYGRLTGRSPAVPTVPPGRRAAHPAPVSIHRTA